MNAKGPGEGGPSYKRRPVKHFFISGRIQKHFILQVLSATFILTLFTLLIVAAVYHIKFKSGYFYYMPEDVNQDLIRHSIWGLILPSFLPSAIVSIFIGINISLFASRKIALPIFKISRWAEALFAGKFNHKVTVRDGDNMQELATVCNQVSQNYLRVLKNIEKSLEGEGTEAEKLEKARKVLDSVEYKD